MDDRILEHCNETELLTLGRQQGLGGLRRGMDRGLLISIIRGESAVGAEHRSEFQQTRHALQIYIQENWGRVASQLPGCDGKCTTYPCSEGRHAKCYSPGVT